MPSDHFESLEQALLGWFDADESDLPADLRQRVAAALLPLHWAMLSPEQRRSVAAQRDMADDPALEDERQFWWQHACRVIELEGLQQQWTQAQAVTVAELNAKEERLREIADELERLAALERADAARYRKRSGRRTAPAGSHLPAEPVTAGPYLPFPRALKLLSSRLGATADELAAWVFMGDTGGLAAYLHANELSPPPRFSYAALPFNHPVDDYLGPLMGTWYSAAELDRFQPAQRFITGRALLQRWADQPGLSVRAFILAKLRESRLDELHPVAGLTQTGNDGDGAPDLARTLFFLADVELIEREDFGIEPVPEQLSDEVVRAESAPGEQGEPTVAPDWAPDWAGLGPDQRARRVQQRKLTLKKAGVSAWRKQIAADLGCSGRRVGQILDRLKAPDAFTAMSLALPRSSDSGPGKRKR